MNPFELLFVQPIFNLLVWFHNVIPGNDLGWAIIALTITIKIILLPLSGKSLKSQKALQELQPKVDKVKADYKNDKEAMGREMVKLYKNEKVSPFSSCLPLLIQFPFLIAIYQVLRSGITNSAAEKLYSFVSAPQAVDAMFLGIIDLSTRSLSLAIIAGALQFIQTKKLTHNRQPVVQGSKDEGMASMVNKQMMYMMPVLTVFIGASLPGGLVLYWATNTLVTFIQQEIVLRRKNNDAETHAH